MEDYQKEYQQLADAEKALVDYKCHETGCLENILGRDGVKAVSDTVKDLKDEVAKLEQKADELEAARKAAKDIRDQKVKERDDLKALLEKWKKLPASIKARHVDLRALKTEIDNALRDGHYSLAYWLLTSDKKFDGKLKEPPALVDPDQVGNEIDAAWINYKKAAAEAESAEIDLKQAEEAAAAKKAAHTEKKNKLEANIRDALKELQPARAAA